MRKMGSLSVEKIDVRDVRFKNLAIVNFDDEDQHEVLKVKGNFWKTHGYSVSSKNYLNDEEVLILMEKGQIRVQRAGNDLSLAVVYTEIVSRISLPCYLAYLKLKNLDYLVFRFGKKVRSYKNEKEMYEEACSRRMESLLDIAVAFKVYSHSPTWSKKSSSSAKPVAYVVVTDGAFIFPPKLLLQLLDESEGVPLIIAAMMTTGYVMLQEFSDSLVALNKLESDVDYHRHLLSYRTLDELYDHHDNVRKAEDQSKKRKLEALQKPNIDNGQVETAEAMLQVERLVEVELAVDADDQDQGSEGGRGRRGEDFELDAGERCELASVDENMDGEEEDNIATESDNGDIVELYDEELLASISEI